MRNALNFQFPNQIARRLKIKSSMLQNALHNMTDLYCHQERDIDGKVRDIYMPYPPLKTVQRKLHLTLRKIPFPAEFIGGMPKHSIFDNARRHVGRNFVLNLDLKNFYPSIKPSQVESVFLRLGCNKGMSRLLTYLTTADGHLPQGFPTSTMLSALVLVPLADDLRALLQPKFVFSFWVDDLTISGDSDPTPLIPAVRKLCRKHGFRLKEEKKHLGVRGKVPQEVTGIIISGKDFSPANGFLPHTKNMLRALNKEGWEYLNTIERWGCTSKREVTSRLKGRIRFIGQFDKSRAEKLYDSLNM
ncbi:hypothetical protein COU76_03475 [Candidatus Peregrinibacteria bacterium CG10_big_fil_rev_8_21_14_0_10_49_10]|nr:MAG: hypothetical protein COU76_03475 [Candidatus Peregrinibacteria bacterium CG10_big_fil_rev_8_21_14_0_10_49_10]